MMFGNHSRPRPGLAMRAAALVALVAQLLLGALPHTERLPDAGAHLASAAAAAASPHGSICQACVLAHAPAAPASITATDVAETTTRLAVATAITRTHSASQTIAQPRAPPVLPA